MSTEQALYDSVRAALIAIPAGALTDIYAISFLVYDDEDDPRRPTMTLGYNTVSQWKSAVTRASDSTEAKWNYAFWLQNQLLCFGEPGQESADLVRNWIEAAGLWYSDEEEDADFDACMDLGARITGNFVQLCCDVARRLHERGDIQNLFERELPVIVHELEYYEEIAAQNEDCNPRRAIEEFAAWARAG